MSDKLLYLKHIAISDDTDIVSEAKDIAAEFSKKLFEEYLASSPAIPRRCYIARVTSSINAVPFTDILSSKTSVEGLIKKAVKDVTDSIGGYVEKGYSLSDIILNIQKKDSGVVECYAYVYVVTDIKDNKSSAPFSWIVDRPPTKEDADEWGCIAVAHGNGSYFRQRWGLCAGSFIRPWARTEDVQRTTLKKRLDGFPKNFLWSGPRKETAHNV